jgi:hypothetical protein
MSRNGFRFGLPRRLALRPEITFMDTTPGSGPNGSWLRISTAVGFNF